MAVPSIRGIRTLLAACTAALAFASVALAAGGEAAAPTVLITGANRGIGLAFVRQYAARSWNVVATTRRPDDAAELRAFAATHPNVVIERMDITSGSEVSALAARYRGKPIDVLINNAALLEHPDRQLLGKIDYDLFEKTIAVNAMGPMRVTEAFLDNVAASQRRTIVMLTSAAGSHGLLRGPVNYYPYRASKAALNMLTHELVLDVAPRGIKVLLVNPGLVDTRGVMQLKPGDPPPEEFAALMPLIRSGAIVLITPEESVMGMTKLIDDMKPEQSGVILNYDGQLLPW